MSRVKMASKSSIVPSLVAHPEDETPDLNHYAQCPLDKLPWTNPPGYDELYDACVAKGGDTYVGVRYAGVTDIVFYSFEDCYPYQLPTGEIAQLAAFCKTTQCYNYPNPDCTGSPVLPVPPPGPSLLFFPIMFLPNILNVVQLVGMVAKCVALL
ncbi:uncharacterized protein PAC_01922 [Phialocephala subalpina]|uniref:Uncharacterized protein n=1 Tax=Phialocephala subalpina TaxID=576137 RepID=A0A1L7WH24_9HELO|nr:uncharacterized protein PAC_01922 [Phialocephala subalpina]